MNPRTAKSMIIAGALGLGLSACGASNEDTALPAGQTGPSPSVVTHVAEGTLNSVDLAAGTANISHGPVASANWPQMTMAFKLADPSSVEALEPGERIRFEFTIEGGMSATVTRITALE